MEKVFAKPEAVKDWKSLYCPGCGHGVALLTSTGTST